MTDIGSDWRSVNRANWDERVPVHLAADGYDLTAIRDGNGTLHPIEEAELGSVDGLRILHLQCHFGRDTLTLAQRGAEVVGLDFSAPAIAAARSLAEELGLSGTSRFVEGDLYDACELIREPASFDRVFVTWGALCWLPDIAEWAKIVAHFLKPGGSLYLAEGHPAALVFDDSVAYPDGRPGWLIPYFASEALRFEDPQDYADPDAQLSNSVTYEWMHPIAEVITAIIDAGLTLNWFHEHDSVPWAMFKSQVRDEHGMYRWPDKPWLPLAYSLAAGRTA